MGMMWQRMGQELQGMIEGLFGGKAYVNPQANKVEYSGPKKGVGGVTGGVARTVGLRLVPIEENPSEASLIGMEGGASLVPVFNPAEKLITGKTVTGQETSRAWAGAELAADVLPFLLHGRAPAAPELEPRFTAAEMHPNMSVMERPPVPVTEVPPTPPPVAPAGTPKPKAPQARAAELQSRASELQQQRRAWEAERGTSAAIEGTHKQTGESRVFVATESPKEPKEWTELLAPNEEFVEGAGHAEQTIIESKRSEYSFTAGGTSRNVCGETCCPLIQDVNMELGGPEFAGKSDKTPYRMFWSKGQ